MNIKEKIELDKQLAESYSKKSDELDTISEEWKKNTEELNQYLIDHKLYLPLEKLNMLVGKYIWKIDAVAISGMRHGKPKLIGTTTFFGLNGPALVTEEYIQQFINEQKKKNLEYELQIIGWFQALEKDKGYVKGTTLYELLEDSIR